MMSHKEPSHTSLSSNDPLSNRQRVPTGPSSSSSSSSFSSLPTTAATTTTPDFDAETRKKRARSARACLVCRERKVKCDVTLRFPDKCSNCVQFNISQCVLPEPKKRKSAKIKELELKQQEAINRAKAEKLNNDQSSDNDSTSGTIIASPSSTTKSSSYPVPSFVYPEPRREFPDLYAYELDPSRVLSPILSSSTVPEYMGSTAATPVMRQLIKDFFEEKSKRNGVIESFQINESDYNYLNSLGCFCLPSRELFWLYINSYFEKLHPQQPIINKKQFLRDYGSMENPKSLLLIHSVLFAGSRVCEESDWTQERREAQERISKVLNKRAKALFDLQIEAEPIPLLQSILIFGNYWDSQFIDSKSGTYWNIKMAVSTALSLGVHRNHDNSSDMSSMNKKIYKRIWWTLFIKDCFTSFTFGRPWSIDIKDSNVSMLEEEDLVDTLDGEEDDGNTQEDRGNQNCEPNKLEVDFFIHRIKLTQTIRRIIDNLSVTKELSAKKISTIPLLKEADMLMVMWLQNLPEHLRFSIGNNDKPSNFYSAILALEYYSVLLLAHRSNIIRRSKSIETASINMSNGKDNLETYPSWSVTFKAAHMVTLIGDYFLRDNYIFKYTSFLIYSMASASAMMIYHLYNIDKDISKIANKAILSCMKVLSKTAEKWPVANFAYFNLKTLYSDKFKQMALIRGILSAANKEIVNCSATDSTIGCGTAAILDKSLESYSSSKEFRYSRPTLSAERGTLNPTVKKDDTPIAGILQPNPSWASSDSHSKPTTITDLPVKSIFFKGATVHTGLVTPRNSENSARNVTNQLFSFGWKSSSRPSSKSPAPNQQQPQQQQQYPSSGFSDNGLTNHNTSSSMLSTATPSSSSMLSTATPSSSSISSEFSPTFANNLIPDIIDDNWLPSFDTSTFPAVVRNNGSANNVNGSNNLYNNNNSAQKFTKNDNDNRTDTNGINGGDAYSDGTGVGFGGREDNHEFDEFLGLLGNTDFGFYP